MSLETETKLKMGYVQVVKSCRFCVFSVEFAGEEENTTSLECVYSNSFNFDTTPFSLCMFFKQKDGRTNSKESQIKKIE